MEQTYTFKDKLWLYPTQKAAWHFVSVPKDISEDILFHFSHVQKGWGSYKVSVQIGETIWKTSIFPDRKSGTFLLPIKKSVRDAEKIQKSDSVSVAITVSDTI